MTISSYCGAWNLIKQNFDIKDYLDNMFYYVDEAVVALNTSEDNSLEILTKYRQDTGRNLKIVETNFSYDDPFCYGKIVNTALQACSGDICCLIDGDERISGALDKFKDFCQKLHEQDNVKSLMIPVMDLYGSLETYSKLGFKWYIAKKGLYRGAVNFGIKENGRPDYNLTSTDELTDKDGNLVNSRNMVQLLYNRPEINNSDIIEYMKAGYPHIFHLGYVKFEDRVNRNNTFWIKYWENATLGDKNNHAKTIGELEKKEAFEHGLPLWNTI